MPDKLTSMRTFVAVARGGSFVGAANKLTMSPQMVARHITALEHQLSVRLLNRTTRSQSLTPAGEQYLKRCEAILDAVDQADNEASGLTDTPSGILRINAPVSFGRYSLVDFVSLFLQRYPQMKVELTLSDGIINPAAEYFDFVFRIGEPDKNLRYVARPLTPYRFIACASPHYLARRGTPERPEDLQHHDCIGFSPWPAGLAHEWPFNCGQQIIQVTVNGPLVINDWGAILAAAVKGNGIIIGYEKGLEQSLQRGELIPVLENFPVPERPLNLLCDPQRIKESRCQLFIREVTEYFQ
ncbi:LysR family transcriptional regulator [Tatumella sp. UBA2305]|uniref:LysR family transcriptional regulator n=1 Tax=Tatumella sp. UBA2305 TaxID=1947647 RepID=UPI0025E8066E|nr:LysR family transcriptional regulator [Tatumella sp. UBA2305]